eukprot:6205086-Pleurochrysis_carterae.AAC.9
MTRRSPRANGEGRCEDGGGRSDGEEKELNAKRAWPRCSGESIRAARQAIGRAAVRATENWLVGSQQRQEPLRRRSLPFEGLNKYVDWHVSTQAKAVWWRQRYVHVSAGRASGRT